MSKVSLKKKIHDEILEMILENKFPLDEFLKEGNLAKQFGASKAPVREALIELCNENVIRNIPRSGYQILQLTERDFREAMQFRVILESQGLRLTGGKLTKRQMEDLEKTMIDASLPEKGDSIGLGQWWEINVEFHIALNACAGNSLLTKSLVDTLYFLKRVNMQLFWNKDPDSYMSYEPDSHEKILSALTKGDLDRAEELLIRDINSIHDCLSI